MKYILWRSTLRHPYTGAPQGGPRETPDSFERLVKRPYLQHFVSTSHGRETGGAARETWAPRNDGGNLAGGHPGYDVA